MSKAKNITNKVIYKVTPILKNGLFAAIGTAPLMEIIKYVLF
jgi:hypothetical protein